MMDNQEMRKNTFLKKGLLFVILIGVIFYAYSTISKAGQSGDIKVIESFFTVYNENLSKSQEEVDKLLSEGDYIGLNSTEKQEGSRKLTEAWLEEYRPYIKEESLEKMAANRYMAPLMDEMGSLKEISIGEVKKLEDNKYEVELTTNLQKETKKISVDLEEVGGQKKIRFLDMASLLN